MAAKKKKAAAKPKLLSGGKPQIPKADGDAPVQAYIAAMPEWKQDIGRHVDQLIERTVAGVRKAVRWNTPFYGIEGRGWFLGLHCLTKYVKVTFLNGASLRPAPPVASKQVNVRSFHIHEGDPIDDEQLSRRLDRQLGSSRNVAVHRHGGQAARSRWPLPTSGRRCSWNGCRSQAVECWCGIL